MVKEELFFVGQKAFIEKGKKILVLIDPEIGVDFPGGRVNKKEYDLNDSLKREVREETKIEIEIEEPFITWSIKWPSGEKIRVFLVGYKCKYLSGKIKISNEHLKYYWVNKGNFKEILKEHENDPYFPILQRYFEKIGE